MSSRMMKAAVLTGPRRIIFEEREIPVPKEHEVLVKMKHVGICGSDLHYYEHGRIGNFVVEKPIILRHESSGEIVAVIGGTNGAHLTSFSLVDIASHGRACGLMNPYYMVFFAPAVERQLRLIGGIFQRAGFIRAGLEQLTGRALGLAVAEGMIAFGKSIHSPTMLSELPGFREKHIQRALAAAKNPQLEMKLKNMPVPLTAALVDEYRYIKSKDSRRDDCCR
jgi:hypothetical protein